MSAPRLNVLMVTTQLGGGGAGRVCELLTRQLRGAGHNIDIFAAADLTRDHACQPASHWRLAGVAGALRDTGARDLAEFSTWLWPLRRAFANADVVHLHNLHGDYLSLPALAWIGRRKPVCWTLHDHWALTGGCVTPRACERWRTACGACPRLGEYPLGAIDRTRWNRWLRPRLVSAMQPLIITPSRWLATRLESVRQLSTLPRLVIPNAVDADVFRPVEDRAPARAQFGLAPDRPTIVMTGANWADAAKGGDDAIQALRQLAATKPDAQLLIVGAGGQAILDAAGLSGVAIDFTHDRSTLAAAYASADVCLFPSRAENYPLTILESLACATPVVAYDVGGIPEQIERGQTGYLARDGDAGALAAGLVSVLSYAQAMGRRGRGFVESQASAPRQAKSYVAAYRDAIARWKRRTARFTPRRERAPLMIALARQLGWEPALAQTRPHIESSGPPLVSVITPSFNQGRFIGDCIRSVLAQNYPRFEHIVIDNCSTDQTADIVGRSPHITMIREPDRGQSDAVNKGLARARGDIIAWINADDYYLPGALKTAAAALESTDVVAGAVQMVDVEGGLHSTLKPKYQGLDYLLEFWSHPYGLCQPGVLFRRSVVETIGLLRTDLHYAMDYDFWLRMATHYDVRLIDAPLAAYRLHDASKTMTLKRYTGFFEEMERLSRPRWGPPLSARYWRRALACGRVAADLIIDEVLDAHRAGRPLPWRLLRRLALRRPHLLLCRNLTSMFTERLLGRAWRSTIARVAPRRSLARNG